MLFGGLVTDDGDAVDKDVIDIVGLWVTAAEATAGFVSSARKGSTVG